MKKLISFFWCIFLSSFIWGQAPLLQETRGLEMYQEKGWGPNMDQYGQVFFSLGVPFGPKSGDLQIRNSTHLEIGYRHKWKITHFYHIGTDFSYQYFKYRLDEQAQEDYLDGTIFRKAKLDRHGLQLCVFNRFNLTKNRGDYTAWYIDLGMFGEYYFSNYLRLKDKEGDIKYKTTIKNWQDPNKWNFGFTGRVGWNRLALYGRYNMVDLYDDTEQGPQTPPLTMGVQFVF